MQGFKPREQRDNQSKKQSKQKKVNIGFANGGMISGPGTGTSDDIEAKMPAGSFVMPADSTEEIGAEGLAGLGAPADVRVSNGEYQLPPEQVHAVGVQALDQMKSATHTPVAQGFNPEVNRDGEQFFNQGGVTLGDEEAKRRAAQMQNRQPMAQQPQQLRLPAPQPKPIVHPQPNPAFDTHGRGDFTAADQTRANAKADTARWQAERAAQDARAAGPQIKPEVKGFRNNFPQRPGAPGGMSGVMAAIPEAVSVYDVATDPNSSKLDVATQAAEGTGRTAATIAGAAIGAKGGAAIGAFGGPFAPITVPIGVGVGTLAGGAAGYWGSGKAIEAGREVVGSDPQSPIDRVQAAQAVPQAQPVPAQAAEVPQQIPQQPAVDPSITGQSPAQDPVAAQEAPAQPLTNNVIRDGNSFSGTNITQGFTVNGQQQGAANVMPSQAKSQRETMSPVGMNVEDAISLGLIHRPEQQGGPQSPQNQAAVKALFDRTPEFGQGTPPQTAGFQQGGPRVNVIRDSSRDGLERQRLMAAASTPMRGAQNGQLTANQLNTQRGLLESEAKNATGLQNTAMNNEASMARESMSQQGANARTAFQEYGQNSRFEQTNQLDQRRTASEEQTRGFQNRAAERTEKLYEKYEKAKPEDRSAIAQQIRDLQGKDTPNRFTVVPGGQGFNADGTPYTLPAQVLNNQTGGFLNPNGQNGQQSQGRPVGTKSTVNGKTAVWDGSQWNPQ